MGLSFHRRFALSRFVKLFLVSSLVVGLLPVTATASQALENAGGFAYSVDASGNATLVAVTDMSLFQATSLVIPDQVGGHPVTVIGERLFDTFCVATSVSFPRTLVKIKTGAFNECSISSLIFPPNMEALGSYAFAYNPITSITFTGNPPSNVDNTVFDSYSYHHTQVYVLDEFADIGNPWHGFPVTWISPFTTEVIPNNANELQITGYLGNAPSTLQIPSTLNGKSITAIANNAFKNVPLSSVVIPDSVTSIGDSAFMGTGLTSVTLPANLEFIDGSAFSGSLEVSNNLTSITIPSSVAAIGNYAFAFNPNLNTVNLLGDAPSSLGAMLFFFSGDGITVKANVYTGASGYGDHFDAYPISIIARPSLSSDATLSGLEITPSTTLTPAFPALALQYAATVANSVTSITVKPTASESHATITVNGLAVTSGFASQPITLTVGANPISIVTLAQDASTTFTYTLTVTRLAADLSNIATLSSIEYPAVGTYGPTVTPTFAAVTTTYSATVPFSVKTFKVKPTVTDTGKATVSVNGNSVRAGGTSEVTLAAGDTAISVVVTAQDQSTKTYTINVHQNPVSRDATLSNLQVTGGSLVETFSPSRLTYSLTNMSSTNSSFFFKPYLSFRYATVKVDGQVTLNERSNPTAISIPVGTTKTVNVQVTAEDGTTTTTYAVTVTRVAPVVKPTVKTNIKLSLKTGALKVGSTLMYSTPVWNGSALNGTNIQWYRCKFSAPNASTFAPSASNCSAISGATSSTYKLVAADKLKYVLVAVTARNSAGSGMAVSPTTSLISR